jgi:hypothetical protein
MAPVNDFEVGRSWTTDLEPGTWYEIVPAGRPEIISGFVFVPPTEKRGLSLHDYRDVDGKQLNRRDKDHRALVPKWEAAIHRHIHFIHFT